MSEEMIITRKQGMIVEGINADKGMEELLMSVIIMDILDDKMNTLSNMFSHKDKSVVKMFKNHFSKSQGKNINDFFNISYNTDSGSKEDYDLDKVKEKVEFTLKSYIDKRSKKLNHDR